jgi:hypothetical protein
LTGFSSDETRLEAVKTDAGVVPSRIGDRSFESWHGNVNVLSVTWCWMSLSDLSTVVPDRNAIGSINNEHSMQRCEHSKGSDANTSLAGVTAVIVRELIRNERGRLQIGFEAMGSQFHKIITRAHVRGAVTGKPLETD